MLPTNVFNLQFTGSTITLHPIQEWQQEDINTYKNQILEVLNAKTKEHHVGADRECFRFAANNCYFNLQFDVYSQSCWIEGEDNAAEQQLETLFERLNLR